MTVSSLNTDGGRVGANITKSPDNLQQFNRGERLFGDYGGEFVYGQAGAALSAGNFIVFDKEFAATQITTANSPRGAKIAVARYAMTSGQFGWFQVGGQCSGATAAAVAAGAQLNTTATAGAIDDDAAVGSKRIDGIAIPVAAAGATTNTEFTLSNPVVGATL